MSSLDAAIAACHAGDVEGLERVLAAAPELVHARVTSIDGHYCGYFHGATLLHHVAGNPSMAPLPPTTLALATLILDRGAAVDATTLRGPSQPDDIGWSTLGLVATSLEARRAGHQTELLELLVSRGADVDLRGGGALVGALYYGEHAAAAWLARHGARIDLVTASGLGRIDSMERFVSDAGELRPGARTLVDYGQGCRRATTPAEILSLSLVYACRGGHIEAVRWLVARGADPRARAPFDHGATPLHWAALEGRRELVELLLALGADPSVRDETYGATARGWGVHGGHEEALGAILPADATKDEAPAS